MSLRSRLEKLERATARTADDGPFAGSPKFWSALAHGWPPPGLTDAEMLELKPLFHPQADQPDPVEAVIAAMESAAATLRCTATRSCHH